MGLNSTFLRFDVGGRAQFGAIIGNTAAVAFQSESSASRGDKGIGVLLSAKGKQAGKGKGKRGPQRGEKSPNWRPAGGSFLLMCCRAGAFAKKLR